MQPAQEQPIEQSAIEALRTAILPNDDDIKEFNDLCAGRNLGRNSSVQLAAIRTKFEYVLSRPKQEHELSGNVTISVVSPLTGSPGSGRPQHLVSDATQESAEGRQRPIMGRYVANTISSGNDPLTNEPELIPETDPDSAPGDPMLLPSVIEDGKLRAHVESNSVEERRALARAEWQADKLAHPDTDEGKP